MVSALAVPEESTDCYGKQAGELGSIAFKDGALVGSLNYVTDYTGFNGSDESEQSGYYLAFTVNADGVTMQLTKDPVACDRAPAVNVVFLGADKETAAAAKLKLIKDSKTTTVTMQNILFK